MRSYWRFHMIAGHNKKHWTPRTDFPHRVLGPPMDPWQVFEARVEECQSYLDQMSAGCDQIIWMKDLQRQLPDTLRGLGYDVTDEQVRSVPKANVTRLKIELGGGTRARGDEFANIDLVPEADFQWDLNRSPYPFPDDSVDEVYSSHCLEHLECPHRTLKEIVRICKIGAKVEIRVPHPASHMAMCAGHRHVFSPLMVENMVQHFPELHWTGPKRLQMKSLHYNATTWLEQAKRELPFLAGLDDQTIMRWVPNTAHESVFVFEVAKC